MLNQKNFILLAGNPQKWDDEMLTLTNRGEALVALQVSQAQRGRLSAHLVRSIYGWTVRYASGLQNFAIIHKSGSKNIANALSFGINWANQDPNNRELFVSQSEIERAREEGDDLTAFESLIA